ncbi:hypothetical protein PPERSA_05672 [Pseudocohnilembus persalinus]|uniref:Uncharacterized protein n=1 Tax=Pseudocohnilembus persalinus TaxID=266149 RepID=A0A0V0QM32_PSEPJ|nr:hypothetical protein PPERSA_05672 [Pseudocohnilembus persalinus]|eukprot:KRX03314.1 hypothetical protein PPERSA_05672 [Pseudocohnilembus persalinus]
MTMNHKQQEYCQYRMLKNGHQLNKGKLQQLKENFIQIQKMQCNQEIKAKLMSGLKEQIKESLQKEEKLKHIVTKITRKNIKNAKADPKQYSSEPIFQQYSIFSQQTADTDGIQYRNQDMYQNGSQFNKLQRTNTNNQLRSKYSTAIHSHNASIHDAHERQKEMIENIKSEIIDAEDNLVKLKIRRNVVCEQVLDKEDELVTIRDLIKQFKEFNKEKNNEIRQLIKNISQLSSKGQIQDNNQNAVNNTNLNFTRINQTIMEDIGSTYRNIKDFLIQKMGKKQRVSNNNLQNSNNQKNEENPEKQNDNKILPTII